ncbi:MAG: transglutaminase-like domain-containing protein, partial [Prevotellaceae bacterium]|nr:transglutaminase-like domain-containing protein [Prevotellaceae bacterium]
SLQNKTEKAIDAFEKCVKEYEYVEYSHAKADTDLDNIRNDERFIALMESIREKGDYIYILQQAGGYKSADTSRLPHFKYESASNGNLKDVRKYFNLDSIAGQGDEISKILNLLAWVHNTIRHDGNNQALCEFDAIDIYNYYKATGKGVNCRHLAITLNECYLAMGIKSRFITCLPMDEDDQDCHVINSVYSETLKKWLWIDPTNNAYVKDENGNLLSIAEVRQRLIDNLPLVLNSDANWNNQNPRTKEEYLDSYMAKNLYWIQCPAVSKFNAESRYRNNKEIYISIHPLGYEHSPINGVITHDPEYFWQNP